MRSISRVRPIVTRVSQMMTAVLRYNFRDTKSRTRDASIGEA